MYTNTNQGLEAYKEKIRDIRRKHRNRPTHTTPTYDAEIEDVLRQGSISQFILGMEAALGITKKEKESILTEIIAAEATPV